MKNYFFRFLFLFIIFLNTNLIFAQEIKNSIVKVHVTANPWDYSQPWQKIGSMPYSGTGCVINNKLILTNAHVVADNVFIQIQLAGESKKYKAEAIFICDISDLAILKVTSPEFLKKCSPLEIGEIPEATDEIRVYGFPVGGEEMSITKGIVSRIEFDYYAHSYQQLLMGQIDAAVNPGNSGGPVIKDGKIVGIIMQGNDKAQNTNYFIPPNIINHVLSDVQDGKLDGFPDDLFYWQELENADLRNYFKLDDNISGGLVTKILSESPVKGILSENDIVMALDNTVVDNDLKVSIRHRERTSANYLLFDKYIGDYFEYKVLRNGNVQNLKVKLTKRLGEGYLVPPPEYNKQPTYYVNSGMVFQTLTYNLNDYYQYGSRITNYFSKESTEDRKEIVILTQVLTSDLTEGYKLFHEIVKTVNGQKISSMKSLVDAFESNKSDYHIVEFEDYNSKLILNRMNAEKQHHTILKLHGIPSDRSENLKSKK